MVSYLTTIKSAVIAALDGLQKAAEASSSAASGNFKIAQSMVNQAIRSAAITNVLNGLKAAELINICSKINELMNNNLLKIDQELEKNKLDNNESEELTDQQLDQVDKEIDSFCLMMSNHISSQIVGFINGIANGLFRSAMSAASSAINNQIEETLTKKFERKNEIKRRDDECRQIKKDRDAKKKSTDEQKEKKKKEKKIEKGVVNPKGSSNANDESTDMNLGDAQMEANKSGRSVKVRDLTTGEIITIEPEGIFGKITAMFKDDIVVDYDENAEGGGHFKTGVGEEKFIQKDGGRDCFLIAADESLGREVTEESVQQRRKSLDDYTNKNKDKYESALNKAEKEGHSHIEGGGQAKRNPKPDLERSNSVIETKVPDENPKKIKRFSIFIIQDVQKVFHKF